MEPFKVLILQRRLLATLKTDAHPFVWTHVTTFGMECMFCLRIICKLHIAFLIFRWVIPVVFNVIQIRNKVFTSQNTTSITDICFRGRNMSPYHLKWNKINIYNTSCVLTCENSIPYLSSWVSTYRTLIGNTTHPQRSVHCLLLIV